MKVLFISDRRDGGITRHVKCIRRCLPLNVESFEIGKEGTEEFAGLNGHDLREFWQIRRVMKSFCPDIVHFHIPNLLMALYVRCFTSVPCVCSWHTPTTRPPKSGESLFFRLLGLRRLYCLPVSSVTLQGLKSWFPDVEGEVFFNPIATSNFQKPSPTRGWKSINPIVGMVGRNADQKDWPSFHKVEELVRAKRPDVSFMNAGERGICNGREAIAKMDVFVMTSKHEQLPTTLLECFALGTPVCGFLPDGGTSDIIAFSSGPVREAFISGRNCTELASLVANLLGDESRRRAIVKDGWRIVTEHFDAEKNCRGQLMRIYGRLIDKRGDNVQRTSGV